MYSIFKHGSQYPILSTEDLPGDTRMEKGLQSRAPLRRHDQQIDLAQGRLAGNPGCRGRRGHQNAHRHPSVWSRAAIASREECCSGEATGGWGAFPAASVASGTTRTSTISAWQRCASRVATGMAASAGAEPSKGTSIRLIIAVPLLLVAATRICRWHGPSDAPPPRAETTPPCQDMPRRPAMTTPGVSTLLPHLASFERSGPAQFSSSLAAVSSPTVRSVAPSRPASPGPEGSSPAEPE